MRGLLLACCLASAAVSCFADCVDDGNKQDLFDELAALRAELRSRLREIEEESAAPDRELQGTLSSAYFLAEVESLRSNEVSLASALDAIWLCTCGSIAALMHGGFAMLETGTCRARNASTVLMKNLLNVCVGTLGWWLCGWAFAFGELKYDLFGTSGFAGSDLLSTRQGRIFPIEDCTNQTCRSRVLMWFFQWIFCTTAVTIVSGGVAERVRSSAYAGYAFLMATIIYPGVVAWTWGGGWLSTVFDIGFTDFAGSGIVHLVGGTGALAGAIILGPRRGRFEDPAAFEPHSLPLVVLGTLMLWFGWYGFNSGSTMGIHDKDLAASAAQVAVNTTVAAASGGLSVFFLRCFISKKYDVCGLCNGILAGLVSITAGCANMDCSSAVAVGCIGGGVYQCFSMGLHKLQIDDPVDASSVHGACGIWGAFAAVVFDWGKGFDEFHGQNGWRCFSEDTVNCDTNVVSNALTAQLIFVTAILSWVLSLSTIILLILSVSGWLRVEQSTEEAGLDAAQHAQAKAYEIDDRQTQESA